MPGEWFEWEWDETLFAGAAPHYERGRLPYAPGLAEVFGRSLALDGTGRLLDVGCGPGTVTLALSGWFRQVVGVDPDGEMLREAQRLASERAVANASWVRMRGEDLPGALGAFDVVVFAASFHWMDRPRVAAAVRAMLEPSGTVVHVDSGHQDRLEAVPGFPPPPRAEVEALRRAYLGADRRAGQSIRNTSPGDEDDVFRAAGLAGPELVVVADGRVVVRSIDDVVHETFSMSSTAPHLFGRRLPEFEADLRRVLAGAADHGMFRERLPDNSLKIWRPAPLHDARSLSR